MMSEYADELAVTVELQPGEQLTLPPDLLEKVGPGRWIVTVRALGASHSAVRRHDAFLHGYAPEDEGLYDDVAG
jgi:hypothetical protein